MLTVMTWNVENLFKPGPGAEPDEAARFQAKLGQLAQIITSSAPDLVGVQEIGAPEAFADLLAAAPRWR